MKCKLVRELTFAPSAAPELRGKPALVGTVIDHPKSHTLVRNGDAVWADEECAIECCRRLFPHEKIDGALTDEQIKQLGQRVAKLIKQKHPVAAGIDPADYEAFNRGEMTGYDPETGDPIPGPHAEYDGPLELPPDVYRAGEQGELIDDRT